MPHKLLYYYNAKEVLRRMKDIDKLRHLIEHWAEHNVEHSATYASWAGKAGEGGMPALKAALDDIVKATRAMDEMFARALRECG